MAQRDRDNKAPTTKSTQKTQNWSFDETFKILATGMLALSSDGNSVEYLEKDANGNLKVTQGNSEVEIKNDTGNPVPVSAVTSREEIAGLTFSETLGALATYTTSWVDVSDTNILDITANVGSSSAVTATIEYTNAADPNTTPPGVDDVTRSTSTTIAGSVLGGIDKPGFSLPAQMKWARISVTDITGGQDIDVTTFSQDETPSGAQLPLIANLTDDFKAPIGRGVTVGKDPDGDYTNIRVNGTRVSDSSEVSGNLPSGATPTYDPVNTIVASNVIDTGWLATEGYVYNNFRAIFDVPGIKMFVIDASDTSGNNSVTTDFSFPTATSPTFGSVNVSARLFQAYYRIIIFNDTGTDATQWAYRSTWLTEDNGSIVLSLDQPILDFFPAPVVQAISKGQQPDGDYVATPADGAAFESSTPLTAGASFQSGWYDTDGYKEVELYISTDQVSSADGIVIEYTDDAQAGTPTVFTGPTFTFSAEDVSSGFKIIPVRPALDGYRVTYTNGGTGQGTFFVSATHKTAPSSETQLAVENNVSYGNTGTVTKAVAHGLSGTEAQPIGIGANGGLDVGIVEHEVDTPIKALTNASNSGITVLGTATRIDTSQLSGRKAISLKATTTNNKRIFIGFDNTVSTSNGYPLAPGASVELDLSTDMELWGIADGASQSLFIIQLA